MGRSCPPSPRLLPCTPLSRLQSVIGHKDDGEEVLVREGGLDYHIWVTITFICLTWEGKTSALQLKEGKKEKETQGNVDAQLCRLLIGRSCDQGTQGCQPAKALLNYPRDCKDHSLWFSLESVGGKNSFVWITLFGFEGNLITGRFGDDFEVWWFGWIVTSGLADDARQFVF